MRIRPLYTNQRLKTENKKLEIELDKLRKLEYFCPECGKSNLRNLKEDKQVICDDCGFVMTSEDFKEYFKLKKQQLKDKIEMFSKAILSKE